jgi:hypothetical protein
LRALGCKYTLAMPITREIALSRQMFADPLADRAAEGATRAGVIEDKNNAACKRR